MKEIDSLLKSYYRYLNKGYNEKDSELFAFIDIFGYYPKY